jgi:hypothetical protein
MKTISVNGIPLEYHGQAIEAFTYNKDIGWAGKSNFIKKGVSGKNIASLRDTSNAFWVVKNWILLGDEFGYVLDYYNKIVYYDKVEVLEYLKNDLFLVKGIDGYFTEFVQKDFLQPAA